MTCAFDSGSQLTLMACASSGNSSGNDFTSFGEESFKTVYVFVIDLGNFISTESADSFATAMIAIHGSFGTFRSFHDKSSFIDFQLFFELDY